MHAELAAHHRHHADGGPDALLLKKITQQSGKYFIAQQRDLGKVNGYIEEMMEGQKVVKVFTHEQKALEGFRELNDKLKDSAKQANSFANT